MQNKTYSELPIVVTIIPKTEPQHVGEYPSLTISVRLGLSSETPDFLGPHDIPVAVYHRKNIITWPSSSVDPVGFFGYLMITTWRKEFTNRSFDLLITHWIAFWRSHPQFINKPWPQGTPGPQSLHELPRKEHHEASSSSSKLSMAATPPGLRRVCRALLEPRREAAATRGNASKREVWCWSIFVIMMINIVLLCITMIHLLNSMKFHNNKWSRLMEHTIDHHGYLQIY